MEFAIIFVSEKKKAEKTFLPRKNLPKKANSTLAGWKFVYVQQSLSPILLSQSIPRT